MGSAMNEDAATADTTCAPADWGSRARYFNSGNAFALSLTPVPSVQFTAARDQAFDSHTATGLIDMNLSDALQTPFAATTPFAMSRYMRIRAGESLSTQFAASVQTICILTGNGHSHAENDAIGTTRWSAGDVMILPCTERFTHVASDDTVAWLVTDEPVLSVLGLSANEYDKLPVQQPIHYSGARMAQELDAVYAHPNADTFPGYAVVLSHERMEHSRNIHPTLTLALNSLPPQSAQRPHRHNSMALTLCVRGEGCYSMIDGERKDWEQHAVMVTPPGAMHSHHNDGNERMRCLIVQDGALYYHGRTMGFSFD